MKNRLIIVLLTFLGCHLPAQHNSRGQAEGQRGAAAAQWKKKKEERQTATSLVKQQQQQLYAGATTAVDGLATLGLSTFGLLSTGVQAPAR